MRGLNLLGILAALVIVAFVVKRQWTATRLPAVAPVAVPATAERDPLRPGTNAVMIDDVRQVTNELMQQRPQQLQELERGSVEPQ